MSRNRFDAPNPSRRRWVALPIAAALVFAGALTAAPAGASPVGSGVTGVGICFGVAGAGGCQLGFGGTTTGTAGAISSSFSAVLVATSGVSAFGSIIIDASAPGGGATFSSSGSYQVDNETTQVGCALFSPVVLSNANQTVEVPVPEACAASPGDTLLVLIGGETNPDTAGPMDMQLSTTVDTEPVVTNELQLNATVPSAPTGATALAGDGTVTVSWSPPALTGGESITGYDVYCSETSPPSTSGTTNATTDENGRSAIVGGLPNGTEQHCVVTAVNAEGQSGPSAEATATPTNLPGAPAFPSATAENHAVIVAWSKPDPRGPLPITTYHVYCSTTNPPTVDAGDLCKSGGGAREVTVRPLVPGSTYYFVVTAVNANGEGPPSEVVSAVPGAPPSRPWAVRVKAFRQSLLFRWKVPTSDGGAPIFAYGVFCSTTADPPPVTEGTLVGNATANHVKVVGLTSGTTYYCVVAAANNFGISHASNVVTAVPL